MPARTVRFVLRVALLTAVTRFADAGVFTADAGLAATALGGNIQVREHTLAGTDLAFASLQLTGFAPTGYLSGMIAVGEGRLRVDLTAAEWTGPWTRFAGPVSFNGRTFPGGTAVRGWAALLTARVSYLHALASWHRLSIGWRAGIDYARLGVDVGPTGPMNTEDFRQALPLPHAGLEFRNELTAAWSLVSFVGVSGVRGLYTLQHEGGRVTETASTVDGRALLACRLTPGLALFAGVAGESRRLILRSTEDGNDARLFLGGPIAGVRGTW